MNKIKVFVFLYRFSSKNCFQAYRISLIDKSFLIGAHLEGNDI